MFKKIFVFAPVLFLVLATTFTKNSTKKLDVEIFNIQENIRALEDIYELVLLDYNYLTSPSKLIEYSKTYFEEELKEKNILDLKSFGSINE